MQTIKDDLVVIMQAMNNPEGKQYVKYMEKRLADKKIDCMNLTGEDLYRAQGAAQELDALILLAKTAKDKLHST